MWAKSASSINCRSIFLANVQPDIRIPQTELQVVVKNERGLGLIFCLVSNFEYLDQ